MFTLQSKQLTWADRTIKLQYRHSGPHIGSQSPSSSLSPNVLCLALKPESCETEELARDLRLSALGFYSSVDLYLASSTTPKS